MPSKSWPRWTLCAGALAAVGLGGLACGHARDLGTSGAGRETAPRYERATPTGDLAQPRRDASPYPDVSTQNPADQGAFLQPGSQGRDGVDQSGIGGSGRPPSSARVNAASPSLEEETGTHVNRVARPRSGPYIEPWNEPNGNPNSIGGAGGSGGSGR
jgi:hypothetical protein